MSTSPAVHTHTVDGWRILDVLVTAAAVLVAIVGIRWLAVTITGRVLATKASAYLSRMADKATP